MVFLHGVLDITVRDATNLPMTLRTQAAGVMKKFLCCNMGPNLVGSCDPYCSMVVGASRRLRTTIIQGSDHHRPPVWNERFEVQLADEAEELNFVIKDADVVGAEFLGHAKVPAAKLLDGQRQQLTLPLVDLQGNPVGYTHKVKKAFEAAELRLTLQFISAEQFVATWQSKQYGAVPRTYFPMRSGNLVRLYHDAHQPVAPVPLPFGGTYNEHSCWDDIYEALTGAQKFILITGWSVWVETVLRRAPACPCDCEELGELLKKRAEAGVTVLVMVWDDKTNNMGLHSGLMATHDQETLTYFKGSKVHCFLCPRVGATEDSYLRQFTSGNMFSHHQKTVVVDAAPLAAGKKRRLVAFVGGLDLCDGRYDTGDHPLYATCCPGGPHSKDLHQACIEGYDSFFPAPREPWHDIHARVEGPIAWDVTLNFVERWLQQAPVVMKPELRKISDSGVIISSAVEEFTHAHKVVKGELKEAGVLRKLQTGHPDMLVVAPTDPSSWNVQLFRSIDSESAQGFPRHEDAFLAGLSNGKGKVIDSSIQQAYIYNIRRAQHYIYVENQYFLGSCHLWDSDQDCGCIHQVPAELATKIVSKIKAGEDFRVYVVIPMYPEGIPTSGSVQAILHYQTLTMKMMYSRIAAALREAGVTDCTPTDYLQFYCLGKREAAPEEEVIGAATADSSMPVEPEQVDVAAAGTASAPGSRRTTGAGRNKEKEASPQQRAANDARRFMIYVHSKMMIVDDEYIIVGSANINQRSMDGTRDTEIAIGAFQPAHVAKGGLPKGDVAGFRKVLWKEHCGGFLPEHERPQSVECARAMLGLGRKAWEAYIAPTPGLLPCHLMAYPVDIGSAGSVNGLPGSEHFPDLGGAVVGTKGMLPPMLTS